MRSIPQLPPCGSWRSNPAFSPPYLDPTGIAFHGTADPWADTEIITDGCRKIGIPLYLTENANHSMETGDVLRDITVLHTILQQTAEWMDSPA